MRGITSIASGAPVTSPSSRYPLVGGYAVRGLIGKNTAAAPTTKYDLSADLVMLWSPRDGSLVVRSAVSTLTCDTGTQGRNGRDQAGALSASSWIYFYFTWDGATVALRASATAPPTGPTLANGETHWAFASAIRFNGSSALLLTHQQGSLVLYELEDGGANRVIAAGVATTFTAVGCTALVPPSTRMLLLGARILVVHNAVAGFVAYTRATGSSSTTGQQLASTVVDPANSNADAQAQAPIKVDSSQSFDYRLSTAPNSGGGVYLDVVGYWVPNGDV